MKNMRLPKKTPKGYYWTEEKPAFAQQSNSTWGKDHGSAVLNIRIDGSLENVRAAIKYIVGYSLPFPTYSPTNPSPQGPFKLTRIPPARHPAFPNLFATKILSVRGEGNRNTAGQGAIAALGGDQTGTYGEWYEAVISILFEIPRYQILSDVENSIRNEDGTYTARPEYRRWTEWFPDEAMETIARKGQTWTFTNTAARSVTRTFGGDRLVRQPKGSLRVVTYDVHVDYAFLGKFIPSNGLKRLSTLNALPFPLDAYYDQNAAGAALAQFPAGTLLLQPSKYPPHAQCHPAVIAGQISADLFPRTVDIERNFLFFDPPTTETLTVDLSAYGGLPNTRVRGHQLVPLPSPVTTAGVHNGQIWFAAVNTAFTSQTTTTPNELLYPYSNFENLWKSAESMS